MTIVERPNKEALSRAIDIFRDDMRTFLVESLGHVPARNVEIAIREGLRNGHADSFGRNRSKGGDLESAIDETFFVPLARCYWDDVFRQRFKGNEKCLDRLYRIVEARHRVSHPPYRRDFDREYTVGKLCLIARFLGDIGAWDSQRAVANIRIWLEDSNPDAEQDAAIIKALEEKSLAEAAARKETECRAQAAEATVCQFTDELKEEVAARKDAEELAEQTEACLTKTESDLDVMKGKLKKEEFARKEVEQRAQAAEASICQAIDELKREVAARREAEDRAQQEARGRLLAEQTVLALQTDLEQSEKKLASVRSELKRAKEQPRDSEKAKQENIAFAQHDLNGEPFDPRTAQYELWLIDEILSGRLDRAALRQLAGDNRLSGRLAYFVQAASSEMDGAQWQGYVAGRQKALLRNGKGMTSIASRQRGNLDRAPQH
ncbi:MAG: hypothetical protein OXF76_00190 [Caldilineaceae bacterium]|nr:hypothetical protein [Caldilineaceae bacterium]